MRRSRRTCVRIAAPAALLLILAVVIHATTNDIHAPETSASALPGIDAGEGNEPMADVGARAESQNVERTGFDSTFNYTALECSRYDPTYTQIDSDLEVGRKLGISLAATRYIAAKLGSVPMRGATVGFFGGRAYLLTPTDFPQLSHHAALHVAYMRMLLHLEDCFGGHLPDVAFVLTTSDTPRYVSPLKVNASSPRSELRHYPPDLEPGPYPVTGIGKSDFFPDLLLVPNFHFHMRLYDQTFLAAIPEFNEVAWRQRKPVLFGRFSHYRTNRVSDDVFTYKTGSNGRRICYKGNKTCPFRDYFISKIAPQDPSRMDVSFVGRISMQAHARFKYLAHLDGQGISSRLEQLLPLGSLVFRQASGYYAYYYRSLLRHRENLVEFWRGEPGSGPEDVLAELDWAAAYDEEAAAVAAAGQRLAATYLTGNGRTCYWYRLLHGLRTALSYTPSLSDWPEAQPLRTVIEEQLPATPTGKELYDRPWAP